MLGSMFIWHRQAGLFEIHDFACFRTSKTLVIPGFHGNTSFFPNGLFIYNKFWKSVPLWWQVSSPQLTAESCPFCLLMSPHCPSELVTLGRQRKSTVWWVNLWLNMQINFAIMWRILKTVL
jgi:hypothetical protein